jgi:hypothetical protein
MKRILLVLFGGLLAAAVAAPQARGGSGATLGRVLPEALQLLHPGKRGVVTAQVPPGEVEQQVPVKEQVEPIDSPAADMAHGNAEARNPSVEPPRSSEVEPPPADQPQDVQQPSAEQ